MAESAEASQIAMIRMPVFIKLIDPGTITVIDKTVQHSWSGRQSEVAIEVQGINAGQIAARIERQLRSPDQRSRKEGLARLDSLLNPENGPNDPVVYQGNKRLTSLEQLYQHLRNHVCKTYARYTKYYDETDLQKYLQADGAVSAKKLVLAAAKKLFIDDVYCLDAIAPQQVSRHRRSQYFKSQDDAKASRRARHELQNSRRNEAARFRRKTMSVAEKDKLAFNHASSKLFRLTLKTQRGLDFLENLPDSPCKVSPPEKL